MIELNELRDKAYRNAVVHGWHNENLSDEHFLCLVISELMEAVEADRKGRHADRKSFIKHYEDEEPHDSANFMYSFTRFIKGTVEEELADSCIRLLDLAGLSACDLDSFDYEGSDTEDYSEMSFTESMYRICMFITDDGFFDKDICIFMNEIFAFCKDRNIDIFWFIEQKMKYNELRPYKHGDKSY